MDTNTWIVIVTLLGGVIIFLAALLITQKRRSQQLQSRFGPRPLHLSRLNFVAENIRNVESAKGTYPSPVHAQGIVFGTGKLKLDGNADFLAEPHIAVKADLQLEQIDIDYFKPIAQRYKFAVQQGVLSTQGSIEYASDGTKVQIKELRLNKVVADYIHDTPEAPT